MFSIRLVLAREPLNIFQQLDREGRERRRPPGVSIYSLARMRTCLFPSSFCLAVLWKVKRKMGVAKQPKNWEWCDSREVVRVRSFFLLFPLTLPPTPLFPRHNLRLQKLTEACGGDELRWLCCCWQPSACPWLRLR